MPRAHLGTADAERFRRAGAQIVQQDVGIGCETVQGGDTVGRFKVQGDGPFAAVEHLEVDAVPVAERHAHPSPVIAAIDTLDLEHLGPEVGEDGAREWPGEHLAQLEDADAGEDAGGWMLTHGVLHLR